MNKSPRSQHGSDAADIIMSGMHGGSKILAHLSVGLPKCIYMSCHRACKGRDNAAVDAIAAL